MYEWILLEVKLRVLTGYLRWKPLEENEPSVSTKIHNPGVQGEWQF
jgi:hypothetical protein